MLQQYWLKFSGNIYSDPSNCLYINYRAITIIQMSVTFECQSEMANTFLIASSPAALEDSFLYYLWYLFWETKQKSFSIMDTSLILIRTTLSAVVAFKLFLSNANKYWYLVTSAWPLQGAHHTSHMFSYKLWCRYLSFYVFAAYWKLMITVSYYFVWLEWTCFWSYLSY